MEYFLLVYDSHQQRLRSTRKFDSADDAVLAFGRAEDRHRGDRAVQVVLVASSSLAEVRVTHGNFFEKKSVDDLIREAIAG